MPNARVCIKACTSVDIVVRAHMCVRASAGACMPACMYVNVCVTVRVRVLCVCVCVCVHARFE
jgi:hypothetical protein